MIQRFLLWIYGRDEDDVNREVSEQQRRIDRRAEERGEVISENYEGSKEASLLRAVGGLHRNREEPKGRDRDPK